MQGARGRVDAGKAVDFSRLEADADRICQDLGAMPREDALKLAPNLAELLSLLDDMEQRLETRRREYERRLADLEGDLTGGR